MGGYLLILLMVFAGNIALLLGNYRLNNLKVIAISAISSIISFILIFTSNYINIQILDYFGIIFFVISILTFVSMFYFIKKGKFKMLLYSIIVLFIISTVLVSSQTDIDIFDTLLYSLLVFIIFFVVYQLTKLLHHAKRQYSVIIGEYMSLASILIFILALTYDSTRTLNYSMFSPFLILTPTYQLVYIIIGIIVVLVAGVLINDKGGSL